MTLSVLIYGGVMLGSLVLVSSEKRDIGKTVIGIKMGIELSNRGKKVLLLDLAEGNKKIAEYFNVEENIIYDVKDVIDETCSMEQSVIDIKDNLSILPFPRLLNKFDKINKDYLSKLFTKAKENYDIVIADINGLSSCYYIDFSVVDGVVIINNNDFSSVKEINNSSEIVRRFQVIESIIINRYSKNNANKGFMLKIKDMNKMLDKEVLSIVDDEIKYLNANYDFLFNKEINSFNNAIDSIVNKLSYID